MIAAQLNPDIARSTGEWAEIAWGCQRFISVEPTCLGETAAGFFLFRPLPHALASLISALSLRPRPVSVRVVNRPNLIIPTPLIRCVKNELLAGGFPRTFSKSSFRIFAAG